MLLRLVLALLLLTASAEAAGVTTKEVEEALTCQCGCGLTVHSCNHLSCPSGIPLRQEVAALVTEGLDRAEILLRFRDKYGEKILAAPTAEGFNLVAWVLPFLLVGAGIVVVVVVVRRWSARGAGKAPIDAPARPISADDRRRLDAELRREDL